MSRHKLTPCIINTPRQADDPWSWGTIQHVSPTGHPSDLQDDKWLTFQVTWHLSPWYRNQLPSNYWKHSSTETGKLTFYIRVHHPFQSSIIKQEGCIPEGNNSTILVTVHLGISWLQRSLSTRSWLVMPTTYPFLMQPPVKKFHWQSHDTRKEHQSGATACGKDSNPLLSHTVWRALYHAL